jgi:HK97 family phage prohead protease
MTTNSGSQSRKRELRVQVAPQKIEVRKNPDGTRSLEGYFCTYGTLSHDLGGFREQLQTGCFDKSLRDQPITALVNHDDNKLLGKTGQNLTVASDSTGLRFSVDPLPDTSYGSDLVALAEQGLVDSCSFGFMAVNEAWSTLPDGTPLRTITEAIVFEGSVLAGPDAAYPNTSVSLRSMPAALRKQLKADPDGDSDPDGDGDEDDDIEDRCSCDCDACESGSCSDCTDPGCDDDTCEACPMQDEQRADRLRLAQHFESSRRNLRL